MVTIHLALSERAAKALQTKLDPRLTPEPGDGTSEMMDLILTELESQLGAAPKTETTVAQDIAKQMAVAGAAALNRKAA